MSHVPRDARLSLLAGRQGGAFSFQQALALGFPRATISRRLSTGAWTRLHPGVFTVGGSLDGRQRDLWASLLAVGPKAIVSHESAALLHGAERLRERPITLTNPHGWHHQLAGVMVHQINDHRPSHQTLVNGLRTSTPARTIVELGATQAPREVGRVLDDYIRTNRTTLAVVRRVFAELLRPGKPGLGCVAAVIDERADGFVPPASELERALFATLEAGGLPPPARQIPLPGRGTVTGVADCGYVDAKVVLEADGRRWHSRVEAARRDRERDAQVIRAGWVPLRFVYEQIQHEPGEVCAIVADTRDQRLALLRRAA